MTFNPLNKSIKKPSILQEGSILKIKNITSSSTCNNYIDNDD
jgi:hypothetical protein